MLFRFFFLGVGVFLSSFENSGVCMFSAIRCDFFFALKKIRANQSGCSPHQKGARWLFLFQSSICQVLSFANVKYDYFSVLVKCFYVFSPFFYVFICGYSGWRWFSIYYTAWLRSWLLTALAAGSMWLQAITYRSLG